MNNTFYCPPVEMLKYIAPTQKQQDGKVLCGEVHDPLARIINNGVSGNAGLFSTAEDLAKLSIALINGGEHNGKRILSPESVKILTIVPENISKFGRSPGWDVSSVYSSNQGEMLSPNTYGHTGYTGTSMVIDPDNKLAIILFTNRVHPDDTGKIGNLRSTVSDIVAASLPKTTN